MRLKAYQPHRKDLLINTEWGIPRERLSNEEARLRNMRLFRGRWVTHEERKRLKVEYHAYRAIRGVAYLLIYGVPVLLLLATAAIIPCALRFPAILAMSLVAVAVASIASGIGLLRYRRWARIVATLVLVLFGFVGAVGLFFLYRKTARQIFTEPITNL